MKKPLFVAAFGFLTCFATALAQPTAPSTPIAPIEVRPSAAIPIRYKLAKPGKVSINIYDERGAVVCELLHVAQRAAGDHLEVWNGLDRFGKPVAPSKYSWKMLSTPGLRAEYLAKVGTNFTLRPNADWWQQAAGDISGPGCVFVDDSGMYISAASENIGPGLVKQTLDGSKRLWEIKLPSAYVILRGMGRIGDVLWVFSANDKYMLPLNANTGVQAGNAISTLWEKEAGTYMTQCDGLLAVCYPEHNAIRWFDPATRKLVATTDIRNPVSMAGAGKVLYVSNGTAIFKVGKDDAQPTAFSDGLEMANCLAVDPTDGDVLIYEGDVNGLGKKQIKRFSSDGKLLQTYGRKGGRQPGLYTRDEQESFEGVFGLASLPGGGFVVAEPNTPPRRVASFDKDGHLQHEWYGAQMWAPVIFPEPDNPNAVWMTSDWQGFMRCIVDTKTGTWKVHSTYRWNAVPIYGGSDIGSGFAGAFLHNGELYLQREGHVDLARVDRKNWKLTAVTAEFSGLQTGYGQKRNNLAPFLHKYMEPNALKNLWLDSMWWTDENGDGMPQDTEMQWRQKTSDKVWTDANSDGKFQPEEEIKNGKPQIGGWPFMDENFGFHFIDTDFRGYSVPVATWNAVGAPLYEKVTGPKAVTSPDWIRKLGGPNFPTIDNKTGDYYIAANNFVNWGNSSDSYMVKLDADGNFVWAVGGAGGDPNFKGYFRTGGNPGQVGYFRRNLGVVKGCVCATNTSNEWPSEYLPRTYAWDSDGLYLGGLLDNPVVPPGTPLWRYAAGAEAKNGVVWEDPKTGEVYYFGHWTSEGRIYKITGWDGWERASGELEIKDVSGNGGNGVFADFNKADGTQVGQWTMQSIDFDPDKELKSQTAKSIAPSGNYIARFSGQIAAPADGKYTFSTKGEGQVRLLLNGRIIIDTSLKPEQSPLALNPVEMKANQKRWIQLEYSPPAGHSGGIQLLWNAEGQAPTPVPSASLWAVSDPVSLPYGHGIGLDAKYYSRIIDLASFVDAMKDKGKADIERIDPQVNTSERRYSILWSGSFEPRNTGWTKLRVGDGYVLRMKVNESLSPEQYLYLEAGKKYPITIYARAWSDVFNNAFSYTLQISRWTAPNTDVMETVPQSQLFPDTP